MPPKRARGFGNKRVSSFASLKSNGARKVIRITQPLDLGGTLSVPPVVQPASKRSPMRDENTNSSNKRRKADNRAQSWANILPSLLTAYKQGYGIEEPAPQALVPIDDPLLCHCPESKRKEKTVTCIYKCGIRTATVKYCSECPDHSLPLVLMRRHLFPMTPSGPNHAVHIEQMRSFHNLHYICSVSVHSIASWAQAEYHQKLPIAASFKQRLSEALPMYGRLMLNLEKELRDDCDLERACPACKYKSGSKIVAADGNMQLRRFKKAQDPKDVVFAGQEEVDWYWVKNRQVVPYGGSATDGCSTWQALEKGRGRMDHLDQNGAFACTCGHGLPLAMIDITTAGEQFTYVLSCLKKVSEMPLYGSDIRIMYDVGCKIRKALQETECLDSIKDVPIAVGIFHITGHSPECQIHFHPRLKEGWGIQDGEHLERLWSFLNGFVAMTRNMSSLNRRLTLTIALDFFTEQRIDNLGVNLRRRFERAVELKADALEALRNAGIEENDNISIALMAMKWQDHLDETVQRETSNTGRGGRFGVSSRAIENLRLAIAIYDLIEQAFKQQGNGHNRTQNLAAQRKAARKQVDIKFDQYIEKLTRAPIFGYDLYKDSNTVLKKNSHFRFRCNIISPVENDAPYDAFHGLKRANEELEILKDEAASVIRFGDDVVKKRQDAIASVPENLQVPLSAGFWYERQGMVVMLKRKLERAETWVKDQKRLLAKIADGSAFNGTATQSRLASTAVRQINEDDNEDDEEGEGDQETVELAPELQGENENDDDDEEWIDEDDNMFESIFAADEVPV